MLEIITLIPIMLFLGFRHALDIDHITAIDNLVRLYNKPRSRWIGLAFSSGHTLAVIAEIFMIILIIQDIRVESIASIGSLFGIAMLVLLSIINIYSLRRHGKNWPSILSNKIIYRLKVSPLLSATITGIIFGLAFDTATQISAIALSITSLTLGLEVALILTSIFAIGMITLDTLDSMLLRQFFNRLNNRLYLRSSYLLSISTLGLAMLLIYENISAIDIIPEWSGIVFTIGSLTALFFLSNH
ncbi:MAG: hypothetical protein KatS3mg003_0252 [Candidatus Nitrosocaldaceae archaeon]|nr:MAG: hypothetical protein KatS3mg003_0252 [Candidatus Nitrosocaldaceae archaeon]